MNYEFFLFVFFIMLGLPLSAQAQDYTPDQKDVIDAIKNFAIGADNQDPQKVALSLHPQSWQFMPSAEGVRTFDQAQYLKLLEAKRIGGTPRKMTVESVDVTEGYIASANVKLQKDKTVFVHQMSLMKVDDSWQIMSILTLVGTDDG